MTKEEKILKILAGEEPEFYCTNCDISLYKEELVPNEFHWICPKCKTAHTFPKRPFLERIAEDLKATRQALTRRAASLR